jgi:hypothetical protein
MAADTEELAQQTTHQVLEIRLDDGEKIRVDLGDDSHAARTVLGSLHTKLSSEPFVLFGETALVRSGDVRYVQLHEIDEEGGGFLEAIKSRIGGGDGSVTTYDTEETRVQRHAAAQQGRGGPGFADQWMGYGKRPWSETKPFFMTSEFLTLIAAIAGVAIAMGVSDLLDANRGWLLITILAVGYMVSRGLAKSGTRDPNPDRNEHSYR